MAETPLRLAYEAAKHAIDDQARALESLRSRTGTLFAATALVTSFLGGQAFARAKHPKGQAAVLHMWSFTAVALAAFAAVAFLTLVILWPYRLRFSVSAARLVRIIDEREEQAAWATVLWRRQP